MSEYLMISIGAASVLYFVLLMLVFAEVYGIGLWLEWRRRR